MAGLGRGIGSLISESNNKKARQENKTSTLGQALLERSRAKIKAIQEQESNKDDASTVVSELKQDEALSVKTDEVKKSTAKKTAVKKSPAKKSSSTTKTKSKTISKDAVDANNNDQAQTKENELSTAVKSTAKKRTTTKKTSTKTEASDLASSSAVAKKTRAKKSSATKDIEDKNDVVLDKELKDSILEKAVEANDSEVSYIAKNVALAQSMQDAMELSYLADNNINKQDTDLNLDLVTTASDDHLVLNVKLDMLLPSTYQPRHSFDDEAIRELATSIKEHGLLEPLIVKRIDGGKYEIICGERRYRAARMLQMAAVPCLVREVVDEKAYAIALIENIQRENLNPVELAIAFDQMMQECGMTQEEVAKSVCKSRSAVANYLRVLKLEDGSLAALKAGQIDLGHAKVLLSLSGSAQNEACQVVIERGLSVRATESFVKEFAKKLEARAAQEAMENQSNSTSSSPRPINYLSYEKLLNSKIKGAKAKFKTNKDGKGKLTFSYDNDIQLDSLLNFLGLLSDN